VTPREAWHLVGSGRVRGAADCEAARTEDARGRNSSGYWRALSVPALFEYSDVLERPATLPASQPWKVSCLRSTRTPCEIGQLGGWVTTLRVDGT
jgi:hypothetical protein